MKKQYIAPEWRLRMLASAADVITTSMNVTNDPADSSDILSRERNSVSWDDYEQ